MVVGCLHEVGQWVDVDRIADRLRVAPVGELLWKMNPSSSASSVIAHQSNCVRSEIYRECLKRTRQCVCGKKARLPGCARPKPSHVTPFFAIDEHAVAVEGEEALMH